MGWLVAPRGFESLGCYCKTREGLYCVLGEFSRQARLCPLPAFVNCYCSAVAGSQLGPPRRARGACKVAKCLAFRPKLSLRGERKSCSATVWPPLPPHTHTLSRPLFCFYRMPEEMLRQTACVSCIRACVCVYIRVSVLSLVWPYMTWWWWLGFVGMYWWGLYETVWLLMRFILTALA